MSQREKSSVNLTNFHDLQLTLHLVVVAVLFELLFEVINFSGLRCFALGIIKKMQVDIRHQALSLAGIIFAFLLEDLLLIISRCRLCFQGSRESLAF